jgi:hypothetical protein
MEARILCKFTLHSSFLWLFEFTEARVNCGLNFVITGFWP